ncbi:MAG TPA: zinc dependent phospholipase C family protein [Spirochaetota bacterium]|nr:zinc dependent phospholipase C family protein [Spirochaetota bacterium]HPC39537.1 zinc dependent phospholipase C family protein [Spirochaetota bacterium]HPL15255.1 zinc dependent phospholipase C family protein [Spirochaetota bacterium]HQJ69085.1 zinc dependent phospholipase C family protein [Spirochaetota bacterium]HRS75951.1 zinc dependent phospholipase C family protein [Spirochaetota bacterium]
MPGIVTHSRVLKEVISSLSKREKKSYLHRSVEALFHTPENFTAGLFGTLGPNIFDFMLKRGEVGIENNDISFFLHDGGFQKLLHAMITKVVTYPDKNTEWAAVQRAYLYGFISHIITDAVFHPYIFYYSGFPNGNTKKEINYYREQNLLFEYNIDNFLQYHDERSKEFPFRLDEMLPVRKQHHITLMDKSVKEFILDSLEKAYPEIYRSILLFKSRKPSSDTVLPISHLDLLPYCISLAYRLKRSNNLRLADFFRYIRKNTILFSDLIIRYPMNKRFNKNILNLHRERWEHPAGKIGLHYESVPGLLVASCEKTIESWEKIESTLYTGEKPDLNEYLCINAFTGDAKLGYKDLKIKHPIRLSS